MTQEPALRRKTLRPRPRALPADAGTTLMQALPRAIARALSNGSGLSVRVGTVVRACPGLDEVPEHLPDGAFLATLQRETGDGRSGTGLVCCDGALFSGLVEMMTLGRFAQNAPTQRRATATDTALLGALIDRLLGMLAPTEGVMGVDPAQGAVGAATAAESAVPPWRVGRPVTDPRLLPALLDDKPHDLYCAPVTMTAGAADRAGNLYLIFPQEAVEPVVPGATGRTDAAAGGTGWGPRAQTSAATAETGSDDSFSAALAAQIMAAPVCLNGVLGRIRLPLAQVMALRKGERLELPISQLEEVEVTGLDGRPHAVARLGQARGLRALRVVALSDRVNLIATAPASAQHGPDDRFIPAGQQQS